MSFRKILFLALAVALFFQFSPGCILDPPTKSKPKLAYRARTSPANVIFNVAAAFQNRESARYIEQLCEGYVFRGVPDPLTSRQDSLIRTEELNFAENLFERGSTDGLQKPATSIVLVIDTTSSTPDPRLGHEGWMRYIVQTSLRITTADGQIVVNSPAWLYLRPDPDGTWCLAEWQDESSDGSPVMRAVWACGGRTAGAFTAS